MSIRFTKMHAAGNDFVIIDARDQTVSIDEAAARHIGDRHFGIGCDQLLVVHEPTHPAADFAYRVFNASGSEVQQCGNGARALARFYRPDAAPGDTLVMQSPAGRVAAKFGKRGAVSVGMGEPEFDPATLPFRVAAQQKLYRVDAGGTEVEFGAVSMGNPHAVIRVPDVASADVHQIGPALEHHPDFPEGVNVGFVQVLGRRAVALRVWERGAGETLACGTGACAAVAITSLNAWTGNDVRVGLPGGELVVNFDDLGDPMWLTGPAKFAFEGQIDL